MSHQRLERLHAYNGWNLLFLVLSGFALYLPGLRGPLAPVRQLLKALHIGAGLGSLALLLLYLPGAREHWRRLRRRVGQKANVLLLVGLLLGWGGTGAILWLQRSLPPSLVSTALAWHDILTWFAIPWATAHAVTRYFKVRLLPVTEPVLEDRRVLLAGAATVAGALLWGRLGRALGLPGLEAPVPTAEAVRAETNRHEPIPAGAAFTPAPVSVPPKGGGGKGRFRVYTVVDPMPAFDARTWKLTVSGLVDRPLTLTWEDLLALPRTVQVSDFHCVTGWSVYHVTWEGVLLADLLERAGVQEKAGWVKFISGDGAYTDSVALQVARRSDVMLPYIMDGSPLPTALGGPLRLIVPAMYGYKSVKWVEGIELVAKEHVGYWEELGYPADAWLNQASDL
jgi:methionine sulfoxide reductase catalytic subunit